jgi:single-stranded-DNA-specific exonuclease
MSTQLAIPVHWQLRTVDAALRDALARSLGLSRTLSGLLVARGHHEPARVRDLVDPKLGALHDPALMPGMAQACARIRLAIERGETILVHGDYDVDGVTGTALLMRLFRMLGARAVWHIPDRFKDGYSFGAHSVTRAQATDARLVISVDNGTSAHETIAQLAALGIDTIVTDHHEPPADGTLPQAVAILNPKLAGSTYPFRELCGGAVAFKLAWGIAQAISGTERVRPDLRDFLVDAMAYVAIATVSDVVPLVDENRVLARYGLRSLQTTRNHGLRALLSVSKLEDRPLDGEDVAFQIGPRINASGRLGSAAKAVEVLLAEDETSARRAALELDLFNEERKRISSELLPRVLAAAVPFADPEEHPLLVLAGQGWHQGLVGVLAAKVAEQYDRPAILIGLNGAQGRGSARTVAGFHLLEAIEAGREHVIRAGGHGQAAGLEIESERVDAFRTAVNIKARAMLRERPRPARRLMIDAELPFAEVNAQLMRDLDRLRPFGAAHEKPVFLSRGLRLAEEPRLMGADRTHLSVQLRLGAQVLRGMAFHKGVRAAELRMGQDIHAVYTPKWNHFRGETKLELELIDFCCG